MITRILGDWEYSVFSLFPSPVGGKSPERKLFQEKKGIDEKKVKLHTERQKVS